jgi:hypothetical protein
LRHAVVAFVLGLAVKLRDSTEERCPAQFVRYCGVLEQVLDSVHLLEEVMQLLSFLASPRNPSRPETARVPSPRSHRNPPPAFRKRSDLRLLPEQPSDDGP